jgi:hypothetical protein
MSSYAVFHNNRQLRVFFYDPLIPGDWQRAERLAVDFADKNHPCEVEQFHLSSTVGKTVYRTADAP